MNNKLINLLNELDNHFTIIYDVYGKSYFDVSNYNGLSISIKQMKEYISSKMDIDSSDIQIDLTYKNSISFLLTFNKKTLDLSYFFQKEKIEPLEIYIMNDLFLFNLCYLNKENEIITISFDLLGTKYMFNFYDNKSESDKFNDILSLHSLLPEFDNIYQFFDDIVYLYNKNLYINYISKNNFDLIHLLRTICE